LAKIFVIDEICIFAIYFGPALAAQLLIAQQQNISRFKDLCVQCILCIGLFQLLRVLGIFQESEIGSATYLLLPK